MPNYKHHQDALVSPDGYYDIKAWLKRTQYRHKITLSCEIMLFKIIELVPTFLYNEELKYFVPRKKWGKGKPYFHKSDYPQVKKLIKKLSKK